MVSFINHYLLFACTFFFSFSISKEVLEPDCRNCVLPLSYWKTHNAFEENEHRKIPWPHSCGSQSTHTEMNEFFNTKIMWIDFVQLPNVAGDACVPAGKEFIAAMLNRCSGACVDRTTMGQISEIGRLLSFICPGGQNYKNESYSELLYF